MKLWIDDVRTAPTGYLWAKSVEDAKAFIVMSEASMSGFAACEIIDTDHDAGDYGPPDYIKILDWLEETGRSYPIRIHSQNPVGVENMRRIIERNGWREVR